MLCYSKWERRVTKRERNNSADPRVGEEGGRGGASGGTAEVPVQPWSRPW